MNFWSKSRLWNPFSQPIFIQNKKEIQNIKRNYTMHCSTFAHFVTIWISSNQIKSNCISVPKSPHERWYKGTVNIFCSSVVPQNIYRNSHNFSQHVLDSFSIFIQNMHAQYVIIVGWYLKKTKATKYLNNPFVRRQSQNISNSLLVSVVCQTNFSRFSGSFRTF